MIRTGPWTQGLENQPTNRPAKQRAENIPENTVTGPRGESPLTELDRHASTKREDELTNKSLDMSASFLTISLDLPTISNPFLHMSYSVGCPNIFLDLLKLTCMFKASKKTRNEHIQKQSNSKTLGLATGLLPCHRLRPYKIFSPQPWFWGLLLQ